MKIKDFTHNITIDLLSQKCLKRHCYTPKVSFHNNEIEYVCARRSLHGCPMKYIEEDRSRCHYPIKGKAKEKWNQEADKYNQWDSLGQDEKDELILEIIND